MTKGYEFANDVVIITGGTRGLGRGITKRFAEEGAAVIPTYYSDDEAAEEMKEILSNYDVKSDIIKFDVADYNAAKAAIDSVAEEFGPPSVLVNNAGMMTAKVLFRLEKEEWDRNIAVNLDGAWNCTKIATEYMKRENNGAIVNISSMAGVRGFTGQTAYCASKTGLIGLTRAVAHEYARRGIRSNAVAFGYVKTDLFDQHISENDVIKEIPQREIPSPEEVAGVVAFLASDEASYITGSVLRADGGQLS
ncbi:SDR family NAD(P)-dependent oxidoreductase [Halocatena halophila]|uniref:SDR family NAD(P)-dependent oxidoreductase n=1 Tax=Halocatena halophila TaxID=2814576 RepID=UPI002ED41C45